MSQTKFKIGVFGILLNDKEEVLWCHRTDMDLWNLPGGGLDTNETPQEGVIREVLEETGLNVEVVSLSGVYTNVDQSNVTFIFYCKKTGGELALNSEARDLQYFANGKHPVNTSPAHVIRTNNFFKERSNVFVEKHSGKSSRQLLDELGLS